MTPVRGGRAMRMKDVKEREKALRAVLSQVRSLVRFALYISLSACGLYFISWNPTHVVRGNQPKELEVVGRFRVSSEVTKFHASPHVHRSSLFPAVIDLARRIWGQHSPSSPDLQIGHFGETNPTSPHAGATSAEHRDTTWMCFLFLLLPFETAIAWDIS